MIQYIIMWQSLIHDVMKAWLRVSAAETSCVCVAVI